MNIKILDAFCGAGGCSVGYKMACDKLGIDCEIVGVDVEPQKNYPYNFVQIDAIEYIQKHGAEYDFIHASPPCQAYSVTRNLYSVDAGSKPDLVSATRQALQNIGVSKMYQVRHL